jgi:hypothetical protein
VLGHAQAAHELADTMETDKLELAAELAKVKGEMEADKAALAAELAKLKGESAKRPALCDKENMHA